MVISFLQDLTVLQFHGLSSEQGISHAITTRKGGVSGGHTEGLNLSYKVNDIPENVLTNRHLLAKAMNVKDDHLVFPAQTHDVNYRVITAENCNEELPDTDALITTEKNIALAVMSADCVPVLLYDKNQGIIAAAHAGWKGTVNGIVHHVVHAMKERFHSYPGDIVAGIGPSICAVRYEVGPEVVERFQDVFPEHLEIVNNFHGDKAHVNLQIANQFWLTEHGIPEENIEIAGICTYENPGLFYSARYSKNHTGRFAACIKLNA